MAKYILSDIFEGDYPVTQIYGNNPDYYKQFGLAGHEGIDFGTPTGTPILAPFDGIIIRDIFDDKDYGNFTIVWDQKQLCAVWFCHLQDVTTKIDDTVTKGQVLGHTNNTGNTTGPHLHFNFVETDASANRLNKNNGYQGFLDALDPNLVEWHIAGRQVRRPVAPPISPIPSGGVLPPNYDEIIKKATEDDAFHTKGYFSPEAVQNIIDNLTQARDNSQNSYEEEVRKNAILTGQFNEVSKENTVLTKANTGLKANVSAVQKQNSDLLQQLSDHNKADSTAIDEGLIAEQNFNTINNHFQDLAKTLQIEATIENIKARVNSLVALQKQQQPVLQQGESRFQAFIKKLFRRG